MYPYSLKGAIEDRNNADYIYSISEIFSLKGKKHESIRRKINQFAKRDNITYESINKTQLDILWNFSQKTLIKAKHNTPEQFESLNTEQSAIEKLIFFKDQLNIQIDGLWIRNHLVGFTITEVIPNQTLLIHIFRTKIDLPGISEFLFWQLSKKYQPKCNLINFEQDLGLTGLRQFKLSLKPIEIKMVYTLTL